MGVPPPTYLSDKDHCYKYSSIPSVYNFILGHCFLLFCLMVTRIWIFSIKLWLFSINKWSTSSPFAKKGARSLIEKNMSLQNLSFNRAQNDSHLKHIDGQFGVVEIKRLEELWSFLRPLEVRFISQEDKARVPNWLSRRLNKQFPLIMHVDYKVSLPDHGRVLAARHKLIVCRNRYPKYGVWRIEVFGYSRPTYAVNRSGKHTASTAYSMD